MKLDNYPDREYPGFEVQQESWNLRAALVSPLPAHGRASHDHDPSGDGARGRRGNGPG